jgi:hypothetical protein
MHYQAWLVLRFLREIRDGEGSSINSGRAPLYSMTASDNGTPLGSKLGTTL